MSENKLPIIISVPHAGLSVPDILKKQFLLNKDQLIKDSDEGSDEIYDIFKNTAGYFCKTPIARSIVDLNRPPDDFTSDGVVKTHSCQMEQIYDKPLSDSMIREILKQLYDPWHIKLKNISSIKTILFGVDCHTMAEKAPPIAKDPGSRRPYVCLSNATGTCPDSWLEFMKELFEDYFGIGSVGINTPFNGGYIIKNHSKNLHWFQLELSREPFASNAVKSQVVFTVIKQLVDYVSLEQKN